MLLAAAELWALFFFSQLCWVAALWLVSGLVAFVPRRMQLGAGPALAKVRFGRTELAVTPLPLSSWASWREDDANPESPDWLAAFPVGRKLLAIAAPWLLLFAVAALLLGPTGAAHGVVRGFAQLLEVSALPGRVAAFWTLLGSGAHAQAAGIFFTRLVAMNLFPVGPLAGGQLVAALFERRWPSLQRRFFTAGYVVVVGWLLLVAAAVLRALFA